MFIKSNGIERLLFNQAGDGDAGGGAGEGDTGNAPDSGEGNENLDDDKVTMSRSDYERWKSDMHEFKTKSKTLEQQLEDQKLRDMEANNQHKEMAEYHKSRADKFEAQNTELVGAVQYDKKLSAVTEYARQAGMNKQAIEDIEVYAAEIDKQVVIEKTDMGRMNVHGAKEFVEAMKAKRAYLFTSRGSNINPNTGGVNQTSSDKITTEDVVAARKKWKTSGSRADETAYFEKFQKYQQQQAQA